jgi:general secretion pathway protein A
MSYYQALGYWREPFSNSPDPDLLYRSKTHLECLQHMEIAVRLRRGLNVVLGEVGTGKTTLGRELLRLLGQDEGIEVHFLDDPYYPSPAEFLMALLRLFGQDERPCGRDLGLLREALKTALWRKGADGRRIVTLVIDEGQKITGECLELLRELLNYESNTEKLLQIVIFAQTEFEAVLADRPNLDDRVNFRCRLQPMSRLETRRLIETRLALCTSDGRAPALFTSLALARLHRLSRGYPRKIVRLCHLSMLLAIGLGKKRIGWALVGKAARESRGAAGRWLRRAGWAGGVAGVALLGLTLAGPDFDLRRETVRALSLAQVYIKARSASGTGGGHAVVAPLQDPVPAVALAKDTASSMEPSARDDAVPEAEEQAATQVFDSPVKLAVASLAAETPDLGIASPFGASDPQAAASEAATPSELGRLPVRPGWPVTRLAARIYGHGYRRGMSELASANPGMNFDRIRAGESLVIPALPATPLPAGACLVKVADVANLEEGVALVYQYREHGPSMVVFSTYQPACGLRFEVVLTGRFADRPSAEAALAGLPRVLAAGAGLVDGYPQGTLFFTELEERAGKRPAARPASAVAGRQVAVSQTMPGAPR